MTFSFGQCECGDISFQARSDMLFRAYCHCSICQKFNGKDFADIVVMDAKHIEVENFDGVTFKAHRHPPFLRRGKCSNCEMPAIELLAIPSLPKAILIPTVNFDSGVFIPDAGFHMFYDCRKGDVKDSLPKYSGYLRSQLGFSAALVRALFRNR